MTIIVSKASYNVKDYQDFSSVERSGILYKIPRQIGLDGIRATKWNPDLGNAEGTVEY